MRAGPRGAALLVVALVCQDSCQHQHCVLCARRLCFALGARWSGQELVAQALHSRVGGRVGHEALEQPLQARRRITRRVLPGPRPVATAFKSAASAALSCLATVAPRSSPALGSTHGCGSAAIGVAHRRAFPMRPLSSSGNRINAQTRSWSIRWRTGSGATDGPFLSGGVLFVLIPGATEGQNAERATTAVAESVHRVTRVRVDGDGSTN